MLGQEIRVTDKLVKSYIESGLSYASEEFSSFYYFAILVFLAFYRICSILWMHLESGQS